MLPLAAVRGHSWRPSSPPTASRHACASWPTTSGATIPTACTWSACSRAPSSSCRICRAPSAATSRSTSSRCRATASSTTSSGQVQLLKDLDTSIEGRDVVIVEDIVDTGLTLTYLQDILRARAPRRLRTACLLSKPSRRKVPWSWTTSASTSTTSSWSATGWTTPSATARLPYIADRRDVTAWRTAASGPPPGPSRPRHAPRPAPRPCRASGPCDRASARAR